MDYFFKPEISRDRDCACSISTSFGPFDSRVAFAELDMAQASINTTPPPAPSIAEPLIQTLFFLYGNIYGRVKGDSCLFYPTCSHYSRLAIEKYGLVDGLWMTGGRLIRAHLNFDHFYPVLEYPEGVRWLDPPEHERFKLYQTLETDPADLFRLEYDNLLR